MFRRVLNDTLHLKGEIYEENRFFKIGFCMECFTADVLRDFNENVKIWFFGVRPSTRHQIQAFRGFS